MLQVTHLIPRDGLGGVETAARSMVLAEDLECDFSINFIGGEAYIESDKNVALSPSLSENNIFAHIRTLVHILYNCPDVLICSLWRTAPVGVLIKLIRPNVKLVYFLHSSSTSHLVEGFFDKLMLLVCDSIWTDSMATLKSRVSSEVAVNTSVISFVTAATARLNSGNKIEPRFVFWGRLNKSKGLDRSISLIAMLIESGCSASYEIWGPNDGEEEFLLELLDEKGIRESVCFRGPADQKQLDQIAGSNTFFLQLSYQEGMAMAVVEAMQRSLVAVVTPVGEIGTYCKHGYNSIVVDDPENPLAAVIEILSLLKDEARFRKLQYASVETWRGHNLYKNDICAASHRIS